MECLSTEVKDVALGATEAIDRIESQTCRDLPCATVMYERAPRYNFRLTAFPPLLTSLMSAAMSSSWRSAVRFDSSSHRGITEEDAEDDEAVAFIAPRGRGHSWFVGATLTFSAVVI